MRRPFPVGAVVAAVATMALAVTAPFLAWDRHATDGARMLVGGAPPQVVAVTLAGEDVATVIAAAEGGGAARVLPPSTDPLPAARSAPIGRLSAAALLDGSVPAEVLVGRVVVVDTPARAQARAAERSAGNLPLWPVRDLAAVLVGLLAFGVAMVVGRGRARAQVVALTGAALAVVAAILAAALGRVTAPAAELGLLLPLAVFGGVSDRAWALGRVVAGITGPLLRATARRGAAARIDAELVGPSLGELFDAAGLLLFVRSADARHAKVMAGWRLGAADLRPGTLDLRRSPFRDAAGIARPVDASGLLVVSAPATLLPLTASGRLEGYLLVAHASAASSLDSAPEATLEICEALAAELRATRLREGRDPARALVAAAAALDEETEALSEAAARARTGLALLAPTGLTLWKNMRFDDTLGDLAPRASSDLARVVALFRRVGEAPLDTIQRLLTAGPSRVMAQDLGLVASATRAGTALLVEIDAIDADNANLAVASPLQLQVREPPSICAALGGSADVSTYPIG